MTFTQVVLNSIVRASELTLLSLGLTIVYDILKFANFAHTEFAVVGVYLTLLFNVTLGLHIVPAAIIASVIAGLFSIAIDRTVFKKMRSSSGIIVMVTSLGIAIALRNSIRAIWGADAKNFSVAPQAPIITEYFRITPLQIWIILVGLAAVFAFHLLLHHTGLVYRDQLCFSWWYPDWTGNLYPSVYGLCDYCSSILCHHLGWYRQPLWGYVGSPGAWLC